MYIFMFAVLITDEFILPNWIIPILDNKSCITRWINVYKQDWLFTFYHPYLFSLYINVRNYNLLLLFSRDFVLSNGSLLFWKTWSSWSVIMPSLCRFLPYVGWATIIMTEKPIIKVWFCFVGLFRALTMTNRIFFF